jgi:N-acetylmuramoyl-L-alanine amidase
MADGAILTTFLFPGAARAAQARQGPHAGPHPLPSGPATRAPAPAMPKPPLVMLDPGHGGKDPGAIGVSGTFEKHVALASALELKRHLESGGRYRVELTRTRDVFIPLDDRVARAQARGAALFVSMHADALPDPTVRGASG